MQRGDSNENSLILSQDKRRGWVARNTTHSSVHSCPVSSFSGRLPAPFVPIRPFRAPQHPLQYSSSPSCPIARAYLSSVRFLSSLLRSYLRDRSSLPRFFSSSILPPLRRRPPPASFVLLFCRRARPAGISLLLSSISLSFSFFSPCALPAYKHRGFIWTFYSEEVPADRGGPDHPEEGGGEPDRCQLSRIPSARETENTDPQPTLFFDSFAIFSLSLSVTIFLLSLRQLQCSLSRILCLCLTLPRTICAEPGGQDGRRS